MIFRSTIHVHAVLKSAFRSIVNMRKLLKLPCLFFCVFIDVAAYHLKLDQDMRVAFLT